MSKRFICGWCQTGHFNQCIKEVKYYDKIWTCNSAEYQLELKKKNKKKAKK